MFDLTLSDDIEGAVTCSHPQPLLAGQSTTCTLTAAAVTPGQYANVGTIVGTPIDLAGQGYVLDPATGVWTDPATGLPLDFTTFDPAANSPLPDVDADDPSHYFGSTPAIAIEKATNGVDADTPTGPTVVIGSTVTWTYEVTNPGNVPVANIVVTDDNGTPVPGDDITPTFVSGDTNGDGLLDVGETWTYTATGVAIAGQYTNNAVVDGTGPDTVNPDGTITPGTPVTDDDPSNYFGADALAVDLAIVKTLNGDLIEGENGAYQLSASNIGTDDANNIIVTDVLPSELTFVSAVGAGWTCSAQGQTVTCTRSAIAAGETVPPITLTTAVDPNTAGATIVNSASITSTEPDLNVPNDSSTVSTIVTSTLLERSVPALAFTGVESATAALFALFLLAAGLMLLTLRKRRTA